MGGGEALVDLLRGPEAGGQRSVPLEREEHDELVGERRGTRASGAEASPKGSVGNVARGATRTGSVVIWGDAVMASRLSADMNAEAESASREGEQRVRQNSGQVGRQRAPERSSGEAVNNEDGEAQDEDKEA